MEDCHTECEETADCTAFSVGDPTLANTGIFSNFPERKQVICELFSGGAYTYGDGDEDFTCGAMTGII